MTDHRSTPHVDDVLTLAAIERPTWATRSRALRASGVPLNEGDGGGGDGGDEGGAKTFTQADLDAKIKQRLARAAEKYADYDELAAKAKKLDEQEAANQTELEQANAKIAALEKQVETITGERDSARSDTQELRVEAKIRDALPKNIVDAEAALALLPRDKVTVGDDGQVTGHEDAVKALIEAKPYLVGDTPAATPSGPRDGGAQAAGAPSNAGVSPGLGRMAAAYAQSSTSTT